MQVSILHPFTPKAVGLAEKGLQYLHSQPHLKAMTKLSLEEDFECSMDYFTENRRGYSMKHGPISYCFYPVSFKWNGDHKKWKKQSSSQYLKVYSKQTPEITIINMSGHSSPFSQQIAKAIKANGKNYIAMLGGQHYTVSLQNREYYKDAHHLLVHTAMQKKAMEGMEMFKELDIRVFPLGVDTSVFTPNLSPEHTNSTFPRLLYVGRIIEWKRIHLAIEAVAKLREAGFKEARLDIIGPVSSDKYLQFLKTLVKELSVEEHVFFLGEKGHSELPGYFQQADLLTLPSDKETFGMVMIEAMACGTPVAGINCPGGPAEVIEHLKDGILTSPENYARAIVDYFVEQGKIKQISENARAKVEKEYSIQATYNVLKESVESVLKQANQNA